MKLMNPLLIIKEEFTEATTFVHKNLVVLVTLWAGMLFSLTILGISTIAYELITNPSTFDNATWGIFDTLG